MGTSSKIAKSVILFDGVCNLCNGSVNFVIDRDKKDQFKFAPLQSEFARKKLIEVGINNKALDTIILLNKDGSVQSKSSAALHIAKSLSGLWPLLYIFIIIPKFIRDLIYDFIARNRYRWFGKTDQCRMPTPELTQRFVADVN
ncbi:MAG: DCC1-like thiol-disulfide oxidoreductase family protein [Bacteroidota bacterium]